MILLNITIHGRLLLMKMLFISSIDRDNVSLHIDFLRINMMQCLLSILKRNLYLNNFKEEICLRRRLTASLLSVSMAFAAFTPMAFAASEPKPAQEELSQGQTIEIGKDEFSTKVLNAIPTMNNYISITEDKFVIDPAAKNVVEPKIYEHFKIGVEKLNNAIHDGSIIVENGQVRVPTSEFSTNWSSNAYWWGVAFTFSDSETKTHIYAMRQAGSVAGLLGGIAAFIPTGWLAAVTGLLINAGSSMISNDFERKNNGRGVTLNLHWLPVPYYEVTTNP